jgi:hypothetical protein
MNAIFKFWRLVGLIILIVIACILALGAWGSFGWYSCEREYTRAAVWANDMTEFALWGEHRWDSVRIGAFSKDGHYFIVSGFVESEDSLKELHSKLENPPPYIGPVSVYLNWEVKVETNGFPTSP